MSQQPGLWEVTWWCSINGQWALKPPCMLWANLVSAHQNGRAKHRVCIGPATRNREHPQQHQKSSGAVDQDRSSLPLPRGPEQLTRD